MPRTLLRNKTLNEDDENTDPWTYRGEKLRHLDFPLGGIGTGNILLQGDGCLRGWDILNQFHSAEGRPIHNLPSPSGGEGNNLDSRTSRSNCWAISAAYDEEEEEFSEDIKPRQSFLLRSANHFGIRGDTQQQQQQQSTTTTTTSTNSVIPPDVPEISVRARYPIANVSYLTPPSFPVTNISLEAMTPLIPNDAKASGSPAVFFTIGVENPHPTKSVSVDVMQSTLNFIGWDGGKSLAPSYIWGDNVNEPFVCSTDQPPTPPHHTKGNSNTNTNTGTTGSKTVYSCQGLFLHTKKDLKDHLTRKGSIALSAICKSSSSNTKSCQDSENQPTVKLITAAISEEDLFKRFVNREFEDVDPEHPSDPSPQDTTYIGAVVQSLSKIPPNSTAHVTFCLSWHFPYRPCTFPRDNLPKDYYGNLYSTWYLNAKDVAMHLCDDFAGQISTSHHRLSSSFNNIQKPSSKTPLEITRRFVDSLYHSTIPREILESAASKLAVIRSPTLFRTEAGIVLGTAGNDQGPLNGTHIYGYTTLLERIFPELAKDMLASALVKNFDIKSGGCLASFGQEGFAIDGALACVIKVYLVVLQSDPSLEFLGTVWPNIKLQMGYIIDNNKNRNNLQLDSRDGVILGPQQTTYGGPMSGANTLVGSYLVAALKATEAIANLMGDINFAKKCSKQAQVSADGYEARCWNEDFGYYVAEVDKSNCENSYGKGCFLDQLAAVGLARACGFESLFDPTHEATARKSIVRDNRVTNPPVVDDLADGQSGIRLCTYPNGKLGHGMPFSDKVVNGLEYALAAGLIGDGNWIDALKVCAMVRQRHSGLRRSPWNEPDSLSSGLYGARSMTGWNLFDQACGVSYDSTKASIVMLPKICNANDEFRCFCNFCDGFGELTQTIGGSSDYGKSNGDKYGFSSGTVTLHVLNGSVDLKMIQLDTTAHVVTALLDKDGVKATITEDGVVTFETTISIAQDSILTLTLSSPCEDTKDVGTNNGLAYMDVASFVEGSIDVSDDEESALIDAKKSNRAPHVAFWNYPRENKRIWAFAVVTIVYYLAKAFR